MIAFAELLDRLTLSPGRLAKIALLRRFFETETDPDRGLALAALTGGLEFRLAKPGIIRTVAESRVDPVLFGWSHDFVGDLAETVALIWPARPTNRPVPLLADVIADLETTAKAELPDLVAGWLDASETNVRYALLKLITGALRVGASARLAKTALAELSGGRLAADDVEEVWHGLAPPYAGLFAWVEGRGPRPDAAGAPIFRPPMLAQPLEAADLAALDPAAFRAEWKWDGIRVQLVAAAGGTKLFSRGADDISAAFPEIIEALAAQPGLLVVLDGELVVEREGVIAPFADLQQRLNRKLPGAKMRTEFPVAVRLYDILFDGEADLRPLGFDRRRACLEAWFARVRPPLMSLSALIPFTTVEQLGALRDGARAASIEGLMLKRADSPYVPGRPKGQWWKWKRNPLSIDAVLMYAQRGSGKRSSFYSDYTFGLWREDGELVPVGKAYSGYTDQELVVIDRWIRNHTVGRFGPVREVSRGLVMELIFDAAQLSSRHKSGVALRFPRIARLRPDKPVEEADRLETLMQMVEGVEG